MSNQLFRDVNHESVCCSGHFQRLWSWCKIFACSFLHRIGSFNGGDTSTWKMIISMRNRRFQGPIYGTQEAKWTHLGHNSPFDCQWRGTWTWPHSILRRLGARKWQDRLRLLIAAMGVSSCEDLWTISMWGPWHSLQKRGAFPTLLPAQAQDVVVASLRKKDITPWCFPQLPGKTGACGSPGTCESFSIWPRPGILNRGWCQDRIMMDCEWYMLEYKCVLVFLHISIHAKYTISTHQMAGFSTKDCHFCVLQWFYHFYWANWRFCTNALFMDKPWQVSFYQLSWSVLCAKLSLSWTYQKTTCIHLP